VTGEPEDQLLISRAVPSRANTGAHEANTHQPERKTDMERRTFVKLGLTGTIVALNREAWALKLYPKSSDKKWAVLYGTWCGSSRDAGVWISEGMAGIADVFDVREKPDLKGFDHLVIGSSIRSGKIHPLMEQYIADNQSWLKSKVRGLWAVCNNMGQPPGPQQKTDLIDNHLAKLCGVGNVPAKVFAGRVTKDLLESDALAMMRSFPDNDNLKRADCMAFGKEILASVK
jgi:menaquinone-dependent protoporphyrinogen IX oxidase